MPKKKPVSVVENLKERTASGQQRIAEKQTADRDNATQDDKKLRLQMRKRAKGFFEECRKEAEAAADKGRSQVLVNVMRFEGEPHPKWCTYLTQYTRELLEKAGLGVEVKHDKIEPFGSDPMFYDTVYSTNLLISWNK